MCSLRFIYLMLLWKWHFNTLCWLKYDLLYSSVKKKIFLRIISHVEWQAFYCYQFWLVPGTTFHSRICMLSQACASREKTRPFSLDWRRETYELLGFKSVTFLQIFKIAYKIIHKMCSPKVRVYLINFHVLLSGCPVLFFLLNVLFIETWE